MKGIFTFRIFLLVITFGIFAGKSFSQPYIWTPISTDWQLSTNWTPARVVLLSSDVLIFNSGTTTTATNVPTQTIGQLLIGSNTTLNLQGVAGGNTLTIGGLLLPGDDLAVAAGSALNINGANATTLTLNTTATGNITGNMTFSNALHRLDAVDGGAINFNSPAVFTQDAGCTGNVFTAGGTALAIVFNTGTTFIQNAGANPFGLAQPLSKVVFNAGSLFKMQQNNALGLVGRTYANLEINLSGFNQSQTGSTNPFTVDNLTVTQGVFNINLTGGINIKGNISVVAGQTLTFNPASTNTVTFNGTTAQSIANAGTLTFGANEAVTLNNAAGLTINNDITLNNILTFTSGKLITGNNTLTITNTTAGAMVGYDAAKYVATNSTAGGLKRSVAASINNYNFPAGSIDNYKPANINFTIAPTSPGSLTTRWSTAYPGWPNTAPVTLVEVGPINVNNVSFQGSWFVTDGDGLVGGTFTGTFTGSGANNVIDYTRTVLVKRPTSPPSSDWALIGNHVTTTGSNALHTLSRTGMTGFPAEFGIGGELNVSLSVKLDYLNGFKQNGSHYLNWKVTCTNNPNVTMNLERSADGRNFNSITTVFADALRCQQPFDYTDNTPLAGMNYYRLKMTDANGKTTFSAAIALLNKATGFDIVGLLPTLVNSNALLNVTAAQKTKMDVVITDIAGKQVQKIGYNLIAGSNQFTLNLAGLSAGSYQITGYTAEGKSRTIRFVKQ